VGGVVLEVPFSTSPAQLEWFRGTVGSSRRSGGVTKVRGSRPKTRQAGFFVRRRQEVLKESRLLLDLRNPRLQLTSKRQVDRLRLVNEYGHRYIKDGLQNVASLQDPELKRGNKAFGQVAPRA